MDIYEHLMPSAHQGTGARLDALRYGTSKVRTMEVWSSTEGSRRENLHLTRGVAGGDEGIRTPDPLRAKQVLSR